MKRTVQAVKDDGTVTDTIEVEVGQFLDSPHPPFTVVIDVTHHYETIKVPAGYEPKLDEGDLVTTLADGAVEVKRLVEKTHPAPYRVHFNGGAIDIWLADRACAKALEPYHAKNGTQFQPMDGRSFNQLVAFHLVEGGMKPHAMLQHWETLKVEAGPGFDEFCKSKYGSKTDLETFLQVYFDLGEAA